jgi:leader peptidase (prepilin peptidase) / N-methyltransferase
MVSDGVPLLAVTLPLAGVVGLFVGSFLNVVIYRTPRRLSVVAPRSFCPTCERELRWWENIPLASWLALRGRCRTCHQPISVRYPLVELSTGVTFVLVTWAWHGTVVAAGYCVLTAGMIAVGLIEYGGLRAPLSVAAVATGLAELVIVIGAGWRQHWWTVAGSLLGTAAALVLYAVLRRLDPECLDARGHGRSALLIAGCWTGGLGALPVAVGAAAWIVTYFACMTGAWSVARPRSGTARAPEPMSTLPPILAAPLVSAIGVALAASLISRG